MDEVGKWILGAIASFASNEVYAFGSKLLNLPSKIWLTLNLLKEKKKMKYKTQWHFPISLCFTYASSNV